MSEPEAQPEGERAVLNAAMEIRREQPEDFDAIARVVAAAFEKEDEAWLVAGLRADPDVYIPELALVAEEGGEIVGHVMLSRVTLDDGDTQHRVLSLAPLAVAPGHQKQGIGAALVDHSTHLADERGEPIVILQGSPLYYGRLGFEFAGDWGIDMGLPDWAPREAAQVMRLRAYDPSIKGTVIYPPAFDGIE